jgi:DNA (cytosine-5)-methyltransferase 1
LKYLSVCSGIEAATVAWHSLGWEAVAYSEIERFPSEVLAHHYPNTPNVGDMTKFKEWNLGTNVDLLVGGTPCQSFSVAGLRKGLDDPRGNLMLTYLAIARQYSPRWLVWENVPGVLSSNGGLDFASLLRGMGELGYGFAYRILDAQYFGVAQRRRRVFVVGYLGDWRPAAAVLFERHSLSGNPAPSREKRQSVAASVREGAANSNWPAEISSTLDTTFGTKQGLENQHINAGCPMFVPAYGIPGNWIGRKPENGGNATEPMHDIAPCLTKVDQHGVAQPVYKMHGQDSRVRDLGDTCSTVTSKWGTGGGNVPVTTQSICLMDQGGSVMNIENDMTGTLRRETHGHEPIVMQPVGTDLYNGNITGDVAATMGTPGSSSNASGPTVMQAMAVRRLTPKECERLQGFPDNYTDIKSKGKPTPDGPRYKALGNSMAVPVMRWIGERIKQYEEMV